MADKLPAGYEKRLVTESFGDLTVSTLSREDLIRLKLFAAADEGPGSTHLLDLLRMSSSQRELDVARRWVKERYPPGPLPELDDVVVVLEKAVR
ncbi:MAG: hypothetical protein R3320_14735 [Nitriliruptorales bacterium]|nr:hypothetical protein [Nitriliruptorales bacterium]